jgi:hypothetical protein
MAPVPSAASAVNMPKFVRRRALPWTAAIVLHILLFAFAGYLIAPPLDYMKKDQLQEAPPLLVVRLPPPPPKMTGELAAIASTIMPRFRPRYHMPKGVPLITTTQRGSPAEALFRYWCSNRPDTIEATGRLCPSDVIMNGLAALPERGLIGDADASTLLGAADRGYSIDEAAVRRGWVKPKPPIGQDGLKGKTDKVTGAHSDGVYGDYPWDVKQSGR